MEYIAYLHKERKSDYGVSFYDFPGCVTAGKTLDEAQKLAKEVLEFHIQGMVEDGEAIPAPSPLDEVVKGKGMRGAVAFLVSIHEPEKVVRVNITARESQLHQIDSLASSAGMSRSAFMVNAALGKLAS